MNYIYAHQVYLGDVSLLKFGSVYSGREPLVGLKFGEFYIAALRPNTKFTDTAGGASTEASMPALEARYRIKYNNSFLSFAGAYNSFEVNSAAGGGYDIDSYVIALGGGVNLGPAFLKAQVYVGENAGNLILLDTDVSGNNGYPVFDGTRVYDQDNTGFMVVGGYVFNKMVTAEAGYGFAKTELEGAPEDEVASYYFQTKITLALGVFFVPEIGQIDYQESNQPEITYYGIKWQVDF